MLRFFIPLLTFAIAAQAAGLNLPLDRAPQYAPAHNPQLAAAKLRIDEARGRLLGSGRLQNPDLEFAYSQNLRSPERSVGMALMQRFPVTGRLRLEKQVTRTQLAAAEAEVRDYELKLVAEVRTLGVKLIALRGQRGLRQQQLANSREQADFIGKRVATGESSTVDAAQLELEARQLEIELAQLDLTQTTLSGEIRPLLGVGAETSLEIIGSLSAAQRMAKGKSNSDRPDLEAARRHAEAAQQGVAVAKARRFEDIGIGLTASGERMEDAPEGLTNDYFLGLRFSLPLPIWNRNQGQIAESIATADRAAKEVEALSFVAQSEVESARSEMNALAELIAKMDSALMPKAVEVEGQLHSAYTAGQSALTELLRARVRRLELSQRRLDALRDYHLARVRFESAQGFVPGSGREGK